MKGHIPVVGQHLHEIDHDLRDFAKFERLPVQYCSALSARAKNSSLPFERFDYLARLPQDICSQMAQIATTLMRSRGFDNGIFNMESMYDPECDSTHIIEVNAHMASGFTDLYEKVDGFNTY